MVAELKDVDAVTAAAAYAYENLLLFTTTNRTKKASLAEKLLLYIAQYISWALDAFNETEAFSQLLGSPDFAMMVVTYTRPAMRPPWQEDTIVNTATVLPVSTTKFIFTPPSINRSTIARNAQLMKSGRPPQTPPHATSFAAAFATMTG